MIRLAQFRRITAAVIEAGYGPQIEWCEALTAPLDAEVFATEVIYVIINSGMRNTVARPIFERTMVALREGSSCTTVFGHPGKAAAIDLVWERRQTLFLEFGISKDLISFCATLPFTGEVTKYHVARNLGGDYAKPDVHLNRLAEREGATAQKLCERLARASGYRAATVDMILWRACADGIIDPQKRRMSVRQRPQSPAESRSNLMPNLMPEGMGPEKNVGETGT